MKNNTKIIKRFGSLIKNVVEKSLEKDVSNSTCITLYQPQVPAQIKELYIKKNVK